MRKPTRRERKALNASYSAGYSLGYAEGYAEGYAKGLEDGNPFKCLVKALTGLAKSFAENPELFEQVKKLEQQKQQEELGDLYGNETHYAVIDDVPDATEEANNNDDVNYVD